MAWTGDIPALSKIMFLTGHNSYMGCRFCNLQGTLGLNNHVYYPLQNNNPKQLSIRTHNEMLNKIEQLEGSQKENLIREYGWFKIFLLFYF